MKRAHRALVCSEKATPSTRSEPDRKNREKGRLQIFSPRVVKATQGLVKTTFSVEF